MDGVDDTGASLVPLPHANAVDTVETESEQILLYLVTTVDDESESAQSYPVIVEDEEQPEVAHPELQSPNSVAIEPVVNFLKEEVDESF